MLALVSTALFTACDNGGDVPSLSVATKIVLSVNIGTITLGESITLTTLTDLAQDVTATTTFFANNTVIEGAVYIPTAVGTYTLHATNGNLVSNTITVRVEAPVAANNSIVIKNVAYSTDNATMYYLRPIKNDDEGGVVHRCAIRIYNTENSTNVYLFFNITTYLGEYVLPKAGDVYDLKDKMSTNSIYGFDIVADSKRILSDGSTVAAAKMNISLCEPMIAGNPGALAFTYEITLTDQSVIKGDYNGIYHYNQGEPPVPVQ
ncbi:hypothetical protein [Flavobacterium sp. LAR06]|uniref:hypothetical protein n=1 Tax=Flavobacterium sp. LAR06 TaxID=3064897 RepID=UPI0035C14343